MAKQIVNLAVIAGFICGAMGLKYWLTREDHRVTYDKEGRYLPAFSLRELAFAMHKYHEKHGRLPPSASFDKDGKPLLSWRVLILPYLDEQEDLYRQFRLDEPWDSPHNHKLLAKIPYVYAPLDPHSAQGPNTTLFQVFVGKGTPFEGREGWRFKDIPRMSYTILIAEAANGVPWTKPEDIRYDEREPFPKLGGFFRGRFHVVMADGSPVYPRTDLDEAVIRPAVLRNGNGDWPY